MRVRIEVAEVCRCVNSSQLLFTVPLPTNDPTELGNLIREGRMARGWSQRKLAATVEAGQSSIYQLERGNRVLGQAKLEAIFRAFDEAPLNLSNTSHQKRVLQQPPTSLPFAMCPDPDCYGSLPVQLGTGIGVIPFVLAGKKRCPICTSHLILEGDCKHPVVANELLCPQCEEPWLEGLHLDIERAPDQRGAISLKEIVEDLIRHRKLQLHRMNKVHLVPWAQI